MIRTVADIGRIIEERDIAAMSIRRPCEQTRFKWQVSLKVNDFRLEWDRGKPMPDFISALESCLGVEVVIERPTDLGSLLE
jgi:hypothetical protein